MTTTKDPVRVLLVDDDMLLRSSLHKFLSLQGYDVVSAASGEEALEVLQAERVACMLLDVKLPGVSGTDLIPHALKTDPRLAIVMLTGAADPHDAALCMQRGAVDYLSKPVDLPKLARSIQRALQRREAAIKHAQTTQLLTEEVIRLTAEVRRERATSEQLSVAVLESLVYLMEQRDRHLAGHSLRVAQLAASLAAQLGRSEDEIEAVRKAGRLHDIGMICVGEAILSKEGPLTEEEFEQVKQHVIIGAQILAPLPQLEAVSLFVRSHHERWDGRGYPDSLAGEAIPWGARLIGAAEIYDALTTSRPYKEKMLPEQAVDYMRGLVGSVLGEDVYEALATVVRRRHALVFIDGEVERGKLLREHALVDARKGPHSMN